MVFSRTDRVCSHSYPTAESQKAKKEEGKGAGVFAWMVKPFSSLQLVKVVDMLCS